MKKILAMVCVVVMLFSFAVPAYAFNWEQITKERYSYEGTVEFSVELNKPLRFLQTFNEENGIDVQYLVESLLKTKIKADVQATASPEGNAAKLYMKMNAVTPIHLSEDVKIDTDMTMYMWMDLDFTSVENATYKVIFKNPLTGKYINMDMLDPALYGGDAEEIKKLLVESSNNAKLLKEDSDEIKALVIKAYAENGSVVENKDGTVVIKFTNNGLIDTVFGIFLGTMQSGYMAKIMEEQGLTVDDFGINLENTATVQTFVKGLGIFADSDAYVANMSFDEKGNIIQFDEKLHIDFNIVEMMESFGIAAEDMAPLTKESSDVDVTFKVNSSYTKVNEDIEISMPVLTAENRVSWIESLFGYGYMPMPEEDFEYYEYQPEEFYTSVYGTVSRDGMYVDVNGFFEDSVYDSDNLIGTGEIGDDGSVVINMTSDVFGEVTICGNLNEDAYTVNGTQLWGRNPFVTTERYNWYTYETEEILFVNIDVLSYTLGCKVESFYAYLLDDDGNTLTNPEYYIDVVRPNFLYAE